jgi:pimeloyl-ACP methyl ester carboxylesterase
MTRNRIKSVPSSGGRAPRENTRAAHKGLLVASLVAGFGCTGASGEVTEDSSSTEGGQSGETEVPTSSGTGGDATGTETGGDSTGTETTGDETGGVDARCGYGVGAGGLTYSAQVDEPTAHLLTETERPDTGEVYCVQGDAPNPRSIVMVPGLGLSHYLYLTTPDRRDGWASLAASAGLSAHVLNPARNVTTADDPEAADNLSMWIQPDFWPRWGFGPDSPNPYADVRYPVDDVADLVTMLPRYAPGPGGTSASQGAIDELTELLEEIGGGVLMVHSAAGPAGFAVALERPELVEALIVIEPTGCPTDVESVPKVPFLAVYGDYIQARGQTGRLESCKTTRELAEAAGYPADLFSYPEVGVFGNTHLLMQDDNSEEILAEVLDWLDEAVKG